MSVRPKEFDRVVREFAELSHVDPESIFSAGAVEADGIPVGVVCLGEYEDHTAVLLAVEADKAEQPDPDYYKNLLQLNAAIPQHLLQFALLPNAQAVVKRTFMISPTTRGDDLREDVTDFLRCIAQLRHLTSAILQDAPHV